MSYLLFSYELFIIYLWVIYYLVMSYLLFIYELFIIYLWDIYLFVRYLCFIVICIYHLIIVFIYLFMRFFFFFHLYESVSSTTGEDIFFFSMPTDTINWTLMCCDSFFGDRIFSDIPDLKFREIERKRILNNQIPKSKQKQKLNWKSRNWERFFSFFDFEKKNSHS